ncbi:hypothetical protein GQR58_010947 [Nymphon striatum]|nr:hypothetical protein GQR58_010947 [Nymphon striatum]
MENGSADSLVQNQGRIRFTVAAHQTTNTAVRRKMKSNGRCQTAIWWWQGGLEIRPDLVLCCCGSQIVADGSFDDDDGTEVESAIDCCITLMFGAMLGILIVLSLLTTVVCLYCQCCFLYKKRMSKMHGGPHYRLHCSNSGMSASASGGVANMYSFSTQNSAATTPLDTTIPTILSREMSREMSKRAPSCEHILVDVQCEIVPPPHSFRQISPKTLELPDVTNNPNTSEVLESLPLSPELTDISPSTTTPSMVISDTPSLTSVPTSHNRNLSSSTIGAAQNTITNGSSETNSGQSTSFRSSYHSHDSGYSVTSETTNAGQSETVSSPTPHDERLYRSTKF